MVEPPGGDAKVVGMTVRVAPPPELLAEMPLVLPAQTLDETDPLIEAAPTLNVTVLSVTGVACTKRLSIKFVRSISRRSPSYSIVGKSAALLPGPISSTASFSRAALFNAKKVFRQR